MTEELDSRIGRAIHITLKRHLKDHPDIIAITEAVKSVVSWEFNMATEESGMMTASEDTLKTLAWNVQSMSAEAPAKRAEIQSNIPPAPSGSVRPADRPAGGLIVMPGDPEFVADVKDARGASAKISAVDFRKKGKVFREKKEIQHWDPVELIDVINETFPEVVYWEIETPDGPRKMQANRNTINQVVEKNVVLTYKHPAASSNPSADNINDLTAKWFFSCYTENFDCDEVMNDPKRGIMAQLRGLYKIRGQRMEPNSGPEPEPLNGPGGSMAVRNSSMTDTYASSMDPGFRSTVDPYSDTQLLQFKEQLKSTNRTLTPPRRG